jgi:hypothetical protein
MPNDSKRKELKLPIPDFGELKIDEDDRSTELGKGAFGKVHKTEVIINDVYQKVGIALHSNY